MAIRWRERNRAAFLAGLASALVAAAIPPVASAKTFVVTQHNDSHPVACSKSGCSLRAAVSAANHSDAPDRILLPDAGPYKLSTPNVGITDEDLNHTGDLDVAGPTVIEHKGKGMATIDANGVDRALDVLEGSSLKLDSIKVTGGRSPLDDPPKVKQAGRSLDAGAGAGISSAGSLTVVDSAVVGNRDVRYGGGIEAYGDKLVVLRSRVAHNSAYGEGGIDTYDIPASVVRSRIDHNHSVNSGGGVAVSDGKLTVKKSTVDHNVAGEGAAGIYYYESTGSVSGSTIAHNYARNNTGGGFDIAFSNVGVSNSTVVGNKADTNGGGMILDGTTGDSVQLRSLTVSGNTADADETADGTGGGIFMEAFGTFEVDVANSILSGNRAGGLTDDCAGPFTSLGGNLVGTNGSCTGFAGPVDLIGGNPKLGTLADNGGPTRTEALRKGSDAVGFAVKSLSPKRDQRGRKRDKHPDSGAFERGA